MFNIYFWFLKTIGPKGRLSYLLAIPLIILMSLSEIVGIAFVVPFIGSIFNLNSSQAPFAEYITNINLSTSLLGVLALSAYISKIVVNVGTLYALNYLGYTIRNIFHYDYFRTYLLDTLENKIKRSKGEGDSVRDLSYEFSLIHNQFIQSSLFLISEAFIILLLASIMLIYATQITIIMAISLVCVIIIQNTFFSSLLYRWGSDRADFDGKIAHLASYSVRGAKEIFVNQAENRVLITLTKLQNQYQSLGYKQASTVNLPRYLIEIGAIGSIVLFVAINNNVKPNLAEELILAIVASLRLLPSINKVAISLQAMRISLPSLTRLYLNKQMAEIRNFHEIAPKEITLMTESEGFKYRHPLSSKDITIPKFSLSKKGFITILGPSGSGKTTLFEIMIGLRNIDRKKIKHVKYKSPILMAQQTHLFGSTVNGILTEYSNNKIDKSWLDKVIKACSLQEIINRQKNHKGDVNEILSGGELNRLAIGRALVPKPDLLMLDEATNGLDLINRERIYKFLKEYSKNALVIMISHDDVLHNFADQVITLTPDVL